MKNITESNINEIREIKAIIKTLEVNLNKFMEMDLSVSEVRLEMRGILNKIELMEAKLSAQLENLK